MEKKFIIKINAVKSHSTFGISKYINKDIPSKHGYSTSDLNRICVYSHVYDNEENPFYIGQGRLRRAFNFLNRDKSWKNKVQDESKVKVNILYIDISIEESIKLEKELIAKYGRIDNNTGCLVNGNDGGTAIGCKGSSNFFYNKRFYGKDNRNFGNKYENNSLSIPIIQLDILGNIVNRWASAAEAKDKGNFESGCIIACCKHKRRLHKSYQWIYAKDYDNTKNYTYIPGQTSPRIYLCLDIYGNYVKTYYNNDELISDGFNPKMVNKVSNGINKSHKNYKFIDFFYLSIKDKKEAINNNYIQIRD